MRIFLSIREHIHIKIRRKYIWNSKRVNLRQRASIRSFMVFNLACTAPTIELEYSYLSFLLVLLVCHKQKPSLLFLSSFYCSFSILIWGKKIIREKKLCCLPNSLSSLLLYFNNTVCFYNRYYYKNPLAPPHPPGNSRRWCDVVKAMWKLFTRKYILLDTRQPGTVFKKLGTRQSEILTKWLV